MMPVLAVTLRILLSPFSAKNMLPDESTTTAYGVIREALVAGPVSPVSPMLWLPAADAHRAYRIFEANS